MKPIEPFAADDVLRVVVETPRGSRNKYAYDPESGLFKFKKVLPLGMAFPFDFGFIPDTRGGDGDPLDAMVVSDAPTFPGCLVECRVLGAIEARQKEGDGPFKRNDRVIAVPTASLAWAHLAAAADLGRPLLDQIEAFFVSYNERQGRRFEPVRTVGPAAALELIRASRP